MKRQFTVITLATLLCACSTEGPLEDLPESPTTDAPASATTAPLGPTSAPLPDPIENLVAERVTSIDELPGDWYQPFALPGRLSLLSLSPPALVTGTYSGFRSCGVPFCLPITGSYHAVPENPAIGYAFIRLDPSGALYILDNFWRTYDGTLVALSARRLYPTGIFGAPFVLYKQLTGEPTPQSTATADEAAVLDLANNLSSDALTIDGDLEPDLAAALIADRGAGFASTDELTAAADAAYAPNPALCTYYRGRAEYYMIRALQCAYSICYPMSPWYGFWAQYYQSLADEACAES